MTLYRLQECCTRHQTSCSYKTETVFVFFCILSHFYVGPMFLIRRLHLTRSSTISPHNSLSDKSFLMLSNHLHFGLPILLFPSHPSPSLSCPHSLLFSIPAHGYHFNRLSCTFFDISPTFAVPLIRTLLILSSFVIPIHPYFCHIQLLLLFL